MRSYVLFLINLGKNYEKCTTYVNLGFDLHGDGGVPGPSKPVESSVL